METLSGKLMRTAANSRRFLERDSQAGIVRFILSRRNRDGGFRGRGADSDIYYSFFAAAGLKALGTRVPAWSLWKYVHSFGEGETLGLVHLLCLIRLRTAFPVPGRTRRRLLQNLEKHRADSAYDLFLKLLAEDYLGDIHFPDEPLNIQLSDPTSNLAAAVVVNRQADEAVKMALLSRFCIGGGFAATEQLKIPDLLSTATALFALLVLEVDFDSIRRPCLEYVESLWRDSGGFAGHADDIFEDVEYTFYAVLSIGCLMT